MPVDLNKVASHYNIMILPYSTSYGLIKSLGAKDNMTQFGFSVFVKDKKVIFYDDTYPIKKQRFTIAHELGHLLLKHYTNINIDRARAEIEANMFAIRLLSPDIIVCSIKHLTAELLGKECQITDYSARMRFEKVHINTIRESSYLRKKLKKNFSKYITKTNKQKKVK